MSDNSLKEKKKRKTLNFMISDTQKKTRTKTRNQLSQDKCNLKPPENLQGNHKDNDVLHDRDDNVRDKDNFEDTVISQDIHDELGFSNQNNSNILTMLQRDYSLYSKIKLNTDDLPPFSPIFGLREKKVITYHSATIYRLPDTKGVALLPQSKIAVESYNKVGLVIYNGDGIYQCNVNLCLYGHNFQCQYKNRIKFFDKKGHDHDQPHPHTHSFNIQINMPLTQNTFFKPNLKDPKEKFYHSLLLFTGFNALSISAIKSDLFKQMLFDFSDLISSQKKQEKDKDQIDLDIPSPKKIKKDLLKTSDSFLNYLMSKFKKISCVALTADGLGIKGQKYYDISLSNCTESPFPVVFSQIALNRNYQIEDMKNLLGSKINEINSNYKIAEITSLTTDSLPLQILSFARWSNRSIFHDNNELSKIIFNVCACHFLNLLAKDAEKNESPFKLKNAIKVLSDAFENLITIPNLNGKAPKNVPSRWLLKMNQINYLQKNKDIILNQENLPNKLKNIYNKNTFDIIDWLKELLFPLWISILYLEKSNTSMQNIYPIIEQITDIWELKKSQSNDQADKTSYEYMIERIQHRKYHTLDFPYVTLAYFLSPAGLLEYKNINNLASEEELLSLIKPTLNLNENSKDKNDNNIEDNSIHVEEINDNQSIFYNQNETQEYETVNELDSQISAICHYCPPSWAYKEKSSKFPTVWYKEKNEFLSIDNQKLFYSERPMADLEFAHEPFSKVLLKETLVLCLHQIGKIDVILECYDKIYTVNCSNEKKIDIVVENIFNLLTTTNLKFETISFIHDKQPSIFWSNFLTKIGKKDALYPALEVITNLALRFAACPASEADCERFISRQRIVRSVTQNASDEKLKRAEEIIYCHRKYLPEYINYLEKENYFV